MQLKSIFMWVLRSVAALIMLQTLYYKFSASEESVYIFSVVGIEPWGRIATGVFELIASVLLLYPRTTHLGALLGTGLMSGALLMHFTLLGLEVKEDGGLLFIYALLVLLCCLLLLYFHRKQLLQLMKKFK
jgi:uncharacterized membrane protein YphA (DoxX/SURF4 family)